MTSGIPTKSIPIQNKKGKILQNLSFFVDRRGRISNFFVDHLAKF